MGVLMDYDATYERSERVSALNRWADVGVLEKRTPLPIEKAFADRVSQKATTFFRPLEVKETQSVTLHREISYLLDAFDALPRRVDVAFDSTWKAFELETYEVQSGNITDRIRVAAKSIDGNIIDQLCARFPTQACEYLFKRLVLEELDGSIERGLNNRIKSANETVRKLLKHLKGRYGEGTAESNRKGAMLLRRALTGDKLVLKGDGEIFLDLDARAYILISLFLYTLRNERFHGSSFSPFVSSAATLRTYTQPFFAFTASYYLLMAVWLKQRPGVLCVDERGLLVSLRNNLDEAQNLFGRHWSR